MRMGIAAKISVLVFLLVFVTMYAAAYFVYEGSNGLLIQHELDELGNIELEVRHEGVQLTNHIDAFRQDVLFLSIIAPVQGLLRTRLEGGTDPMDAGTEAEWRDKVKFLFTKFVHNKTDVVRICYIDTVDSPGNSVCVNRVKDQAPSVAELALESDMDESFAIKTLALEPGKAYLSDIRLNRAGGELVQPHAPILRAAAPLHYLRENAVGLVFVDMDMSSAFNELEDLLPMHIEHFRFITNSEGDFIKHPDPDMVFGFEQGKRHRAQDAYPDLALLYDKTAQIEDEWVNELSPMSSDNMVYIAKIHFDPDRPERFLSLAMVASYRAFIADTEAVRDQSIMVIMALIVVATILAFFFSRILTRPLNQMTEAARDDSSEMFEAALPVKRNDEIGVLARSFQSMMQHIDERNSALRKSEQRVRLLLDSTGEAICGVDLDGNCTFCNRAAIELLGYQTQDDILGKNLHSLIHHTRADGNIYPVEDCRISQAFREGRAIHADDEVFWRADGSSFPIIYRSYPVRRDDEVMGAVVTFVDITDLKQALAEKTRLASAVEQAVEGVCIMDHERTISYVNPAFERLTGYAKGELIGKKISILRNPVHDEAFYQRMWDTLHKGGAWQGYITIARKDGDSMELERSITPIRDDEGRIVSFVSVHRDVSQERAMQSRMEHAQRLESLGVLAGGIAHDFNNLLTAIIGNASLASKKLDPLAPVHEEILCIEDAAGSAADLCRQLLAYGGKGKFVIAPVNLAALVRDISKLLEVSVGKSVVLKYDLPVDLPAVDADAAQMKQVIMNLIINASEAIGGGEGEIFIRAGLMRVDQEFLANAAIDEQLPESEYVFLEVRDSGCGMDGATMEKVFDPFFTTKVTGRGLGMSAVLGIVRGHGGTIKVSSKPGQGTTFTMVLPPSEKEAKSLADGKEEDGDWQGSGTILVVDDEERVRRVASMMLEELGFDVLLAEDGEQGVEVFQREHGHIDAVLLDMTMPKMNGEQAFREMRRIQPDACVILSSGFNKPDVKDAFSAKGLAGFMQKPYSVSALRNKLREALEGGEAGA